MTTSTSTIMCADAVLGAHAGRVIDTSGDRTILAFDSASAAVAASVEIQQARAALADGAPVRMGLATGDVDLLRLIADGRSNREIGGPTTVGQR